MSEITYTGFYVIIIYRFLWNEHIGCCRLRIEESAVTIILISDAGCKSGLVDDCSIKGTNRLNVIVA